MSRALDALLDRALAAAGDTDVVPVDLQMELAAEGFDLDMLDAELNARRQGDLI